MAPPNRLRLVTLLLLAALAAGCAAPAPQPTPTPQAVRPSPVPTAPRLGYTPVPPEQVSPVVLQRTPARGEELRPGDPIELVFDRPMDKDSVRAALSLSPGVAGSLEWPDARTVRFRPSRPLERAALYDVVLGQGARAVDGAQLNGAYQFRFATAGFLEVGQTIPADGAPDVQADSTITVMFNRPIVPLVAVEQQAGLPQPLTFDPPIQGQGEWLNTAIYTFTPSQPLAGGTTYTGRVNAGLLDTDGNPMRGEYSWHFTVARPQVVSVSPPDGTTLQPLQPQIALEFNQPVDEGAARSAFRLLGPSGDIPGELRVQGPTLVFTPSQRLEFDSAYTIAVAASLGGAGGGSGMAGDFSASFRTVPLPRILGTEPADGATAPPYTDFAILFNAPIDPATVMPNVRFTPPISPTQVYTYFDTYNNTFRINFGPQPSSEYRVEIGPDIADPYGNTTGQTLDVRFRTAPLPPFAQILTPGLVATYNASSPARVGISSVNQDQAALALYRLPIAALRRPLWELGDQQLPSGAQELRRWQARLDTRPDQATLTRVDLLEGGGPLDPGLYLLRMDMPGGGFQPHVLVVSALNLTLKAGERDGLVWATDLQRGQPVAGLQLDLLDQQGQALGSATTDASGVARATFSRTTNNGLLAIASQPFAAGALDWSSGIGPWEFGLPANPDLQDFTAHVYTDRPIYRPGQEVRFKGLLRADDDATYSLPTGAGPVELAVMSPGGEEIYRQVLQLGPGGSFDGSLTLAEGAPTGVYSLYGTVGDYSFGTSFQVAAYRPPEIQTTVTPRAAEIVRGTAPEATVEVSYFFGGPATGVPVQWAAMAEPYRFAPAWGARYQWSDADDPWICWDCWWRPQPPPVPLATGSGTTDAQGRLTIALPAELRNTQGTPLSGSVRLTIEATAMGRDNQAISGRTQVVVHAGDLYVGLAPRSYLGRAGREQQVDVATASRDGQRLPNQVVQVDIFKITYFSALPRVDTVQVPPGCTVYNDNQLTCSVAHQEISTGANGEALLRFTPADGGTYKLEARARDAGGREVRSALFLWVAGDAFTPWLRENNDRVNLVSDKTEYRVGETASVLVPSPFQGPHWALFTVERGGVLRHEVRQVSGNSIVYQLPIEAGHVPNVYVSVTLIAAPGSSGSSYADYKVGMLPISVAPEPQTLRVTITPSAAQAQPGQTVTYEVQVSDLAGRPQAAELSLDLVDKAVLSLRPREPDAILKAFYANRPLGVITASGLSIFADRLLAQLQEATDEQQRQARGGGFDAINAGLPATAGAPAAQPTAAPAAAADSAAEEKAMGQAGGEQPLTVREAFADTAYWNANVTTDASGRASVQVKLPDNLTTWVMRGVAATIDTKVGEGTVELVATKPLLVRPVTPRFFTVGDAAELAANVSNNTDQPLRAEVGLAATGLTLTTPQTVTLDIPAHGEAQATWQVATQDVTAAGLVFTALSGQYGDASKPRLATGPDGSLPVYRYSVPEVVGTGGQLEAAGARTEVVGLPPRLDTRSGELRVRLDPSLAAGLRDALTYLEYYEYDSAEATVSRFLPNVLAARALKKLGAPNAELEARLPGLVEEGLDRLYRQQQGDGGWGWWVDSQSNPYVSAYVVFGMLKAKEAGFAVREDVLTRGLDYLQAQLLPTGRAVSDWDPGEADRQAWLLYVLAEAGRPAGGHLDDLYAAREKLGVAARAFLTMALQRANAGDARLKTLVSDLNNAAIVSATGAHWEEQARGWWGFGTDTRTTAVALAALLRVQQSGSASGGGGTGGAAAPLLPNVVRWLMIARQLGVWETTQETAWAVIALTDWMELTGELQGRYDYALWLNGAEKAAGSVTPENVGQPVELVVPVAELARDQGNRLQVGRGEGPGRLYYTAHLRAFLPVEEVKALDRGVAVTRRYVAASCQDGPRCPEVREVKLGDTVRVELAITAPNDLYYLRVEDGLPAGFEAVDPALATTSQLAPGPQIDTPMPVDGPVMVEEAARASVASPYPWWGWWWRWYSRSELRDEKVALFADFLPRGSYLYSYTMRATLPGEFRAIPAVAVESYFPEVYGRSDGALLRVTR
ncbi:MAG TPA: Ig-like domain-containing protein [Roseiflexaceae bacterium]|nr:Ig-like domain-containing protein [Roseiflexaceae bacterium]